MQNIMETKMTSNISQRVTSAQKHLLCWAVISLLKSPQPVFTECTGPKSKLTKSSDYYIAVVKKSTAVDFSPMHRNILIQLQKKQRL